MEESDKTCAQCGEAGETKKCSACKVTFYCSVACQKYHWKVHKRQCKKAAPKEQKPKDTPEFNLTQAQQEVQNDIIRGDYPDRIKAKSFETFCNEFPLTTEAMENLIGRQAAKDYILLPEMPLNTSVTIKAVGSLNYNPLTKENLHMVRYKHFTELRPDLYPPGQNPVQDYMPEENVSPAYIKYFFPSNPERIIVARVNYIMWFPLNDFFTDFALRRLRGLPHLLPLPDVYIDEDEQWMATLFNASKGRIHYCSGPNKSHKSVPMVSPSA